jgi:hypothetical protein
MPVCHHPIGYPHFPYSVEMLTGNIHINGPVPTACVHKSSYSLLPRSGRLVRLVQVASDGAVAEHDLDRLDGGNGGVQRRCRDLQCGDVVALGGRGEELGEGDRGFCCLSPYCELLFVWREDSPAQVFGEAFSFYVGSWSVWRDWVVFCWRDCTYVSFIMSSCSATALEREMLVADLVETSA